MTIIETKNPMKNMPQHTQNEKKTEGTLEDIAHSQREREHEGGDGRSDEKIAIPAGKKGEQQRHCQLL
jgi:hypothetical protein